MTHSAANPQFTAPGETAPEGSPQTQFVVSASSAPEEVVAAANAALANYGAAEEAGHTDIPPAGVYVGADVRWVPANEALAPPQ